MQNCPYLCKYKDVFYIFGTNLFFFLRGSIKFLGSGLKFRVGRVSGSTTFFLYDLILKIHILIKRYLKIFSDREIHFKGVRIISWMSKGSKYTEKKYTEDIFIFRKFLLWLVWSGVLAESFTLRATTLEVWYLFMFINVLLSSVCL
jgi:hypothetical protein